MSLMLVLFRRSSSSAYLFLDHRAPFPIPLLVSPVLTSVTLASHSDSSRCPHLPCFCARTAATLSGNTFSILPLSLRFFHVPTLNSRILPFVILG